MFNRNGIIKDLKRFFNLKKDRQDAINNTKAKKLPTTYGVNELAKELHPEFIKAKVKEINKTSNNVTILTFESKKFPYFKAGQFVTLSLKINDEIVTRPYSIFSSPKEALKGILKLAIQNVGYFSNEVSKLKIGTEVLIGEPSGDFYFDNIRDKKDIVAIAGGSGITPFVSMAKSIDEGTDDFNLTIIYGVKTLNDIIYDFKEIKCKKVKIIFVLSEENNKDYKHGFINKDILKDYVNENTSVFMCGPDKMYEFVDGELSKLKFDKTRIRKEHNAIKDLLINNPKDFNLKVHIRDKIYEVKAKENETLLTTLEKAKLLVPSRCRSGICGHCHTRLIKGNVYVPEKHDHVRMADKKFNYIHICASYPKSDLEIDVPYQNRFEELV